MTTENEQTPAATEATTTTQSTEPTLEQVYRDFNVQLPGVEQQQPRQEMRTEQPAQPAQPAQPLSIPDANQDPDGFRRWLENTARTQSVLTQSVQQLHGMLAEQVRGQQENLLQKDIASAVDTMNEHVKLPDNQKRLLQFAMEQKARDDPRFLQIWNNRQRNPIAYQRALVAVGKEFGELFSVKVDPQLRADREALRASQAGSAVARDTPGPEIPAAALAPAGSAEFERWWTGQARSHQ